MTRYRLRRPAGAVAVVVRLVIGVVAAIVVLGQANGPAVTVIGGPSGNQLHSFAGDIWVPLADADTTGWQALEPDKDKMIVLYCDCPWAEAAKASVILEAHGFGDDHLRVLHEGIPGWAQLGYPIVAGGNPYQAERNWPQACGGG